MKFEEWFLNNGIPLDDDFNVAKRAYEAGASSRQAEIDALQKRIDLALSAVWDDKCSHTVIDILKGDKND